MRPALWIMAGDHWKMRHSARIAGRNAKGY